MRLRIALTLIVLFLGLSLSNVEARQLLVNASSAVSIAPSGQSLESRLLMTFPLPQVVVGRTVDFACISFDANCSGEGNAVSFEAFHITTAWNAGTVSWTQPWSNPGGDWDTNRSADWVVPEGSGKKVYLDITEIVNGWLRGSFGNYGVIVKVSEPFTGTFTWNEVSPELRILY